MQGRISRNSKIPFFERSQNFELRGKFKNSKCCASKRIRCASITFMSVTMHTYIIIQYDIFNHT